MKQNKQKKCKCGHVESRHDFDGKCLNNSGPWHEGKMPECKCTEFKPSKKRG